MKGDATTHTTNEKYREQYDKIEWKPKPKQLELPIADCCEPRDA